MPRGTATPWQPTWRRVITGSAGAFMVVLGFLGGRMDGGADPGLAASETKTHQKATVTPSAVTTTTITQAPDPNPPTTHSS
jgi:hypothetical protein